MAGTTTYYGISYPTATDYVKDGASAMQTIATGFDTAVAIPTYNNQTGTSYTFVLTDTGKTVTSNNASAVTFTIPPQASVAWADNTTLTVRNLGAGVVTIAGGAGVTVTNTAQTVAQYGAIRIIRTASNAWIVVPAGASSSGSWISYTPSFTAGGPTSVGNGVLTGAYSQVGKTVNFRIKFVVGSTTTIGRTDWVISLPSTSTSTMAVSSYAYDDSSTISPIMVAWITGATCTLRRVSGVNGDYIEANSPFTWAVNDYVMITGTYEVA